MGWIQNIPWGPQGMSGLSHIDLLSAIEKAEERIQLLREELAELKPVPVTLDEYLPGDVEDLRIRANTEQKQVLFRVYKERVLARLVASGIDEAYLAEESRKRFVEAQRILHARIAKRQAELNRLLEEFERRTAP